VGYRKGNEEMTKAEIICDSISPDGVRLTTFVVTFHRFVLAEFNTHRVFSRNSASSRAIPIEKMINRVRENPALPISWGSNKPGMQAGAELAPGIKAACLGFWARAMHTALDMAATLYDAGLHKQVANRLLEPFNWHTAVVTAVDFDNFFWQRCHPDAQPEMKAAADAMQRAYYSSTPNPIAIGEWHLPFIRPAESAALPIDELKQVSTARCARVSYLQHDGTRDWQKDIDLYNKLVQGSHWSPFEHVATPCTHVQEIDNFYEGEVGESDDQPLALHLVCRLTGNFARGWHQYRKFFRQENKIDFIPNL
jgi:thymidylate synthase ThyX